MAGYDFIKHIEDALTQGEESSFKVNLLKESFDKAKSSLINYYGVSNLYSPDLKSGESYSNMLKQISEDFSTLFEQMKYMRSSYLPIEFVKETLNAAGNIENFQEIIDQEGLYESYENTFFRMLGMPSTNSLPDGEPLIRIGSSGKFYGTNDGSTKEDYNLFLDNRQVPTIDRFTYPNARFFDFVGKPVSPVELLRNDPYFISDTVIGVLSDICEKLKYLYTTPDVEKTVIETQIAYIMQQLSREDLGIKIISIEDGSSVDVTEDQRNIIEEQLKTYLIIEPGITNVESVNSDKDQKYLNLVQNIVAFLTYENSIDENFYKLIFDELISENIPATIDNLINENVFWRFSYLMFPPVQDGRISSCINEPSKMVAPLFSPESKRIVNGQKMKSSLLEAIIRIRLDIISGTNLTSTPSTTGQSVATLLNEKTTNVTFNMIKPMFGLLESLIIIRLFGALEGMANNINESIKEIASVQGTTGFVPDVSAGKNDGGKDPLVDAGKKDESLSALEQMQFVEQSILLLLGENSYPEAISLQEGTIRNSGVKESHLMDTVISLINVPSRWIEYQSSKLKEEDERTDDKAQSTAVANIKNKLGISKGVGALDVLVFLISLFTANEDVLLSLLTKEEFYNMKLQFPDGFFDGFNRNNISMSQAVNDIAFRAYDTYQLFRILLRTSNDNAFPSEQVTADD